MDGLSAHNSLFANRQHQIFWAIRHLVSSKTFCANADTWPQGFQVAGGGRGGSQRRMAALQAAQEAVGRAAFPPTGGKDRRAGPPSGEARPPLLLRKGVPLSSEISREGGVEQASPAAGLMSPISSRQH